MLNSMITSITNTILELAEFSLIIEVTLMLSGYNVWTELGLLNQENNV